jgi:hypothetical protein
MINDLKWEVIVRFADYDCWQSLADYDCWQSLAALSFHNDEFISE